MSKSIPLTNLPAQITGDNETHPIEGALDAFLRSMDDYRDAVRIAIPAIAKERSDSLNKIIRKLEAYVEKASGNGSHQGEIQSAHEAKMFIDHMDEVKRLTESRLIPLTSRGVFIGIFSEYDSFIGNLLKAVYYKRQDLLRDISKNISLKDLMGFSTLEEIKRDMLEQEIDSFRRNSYIEQFSDLEKKFSVSTLSHFAEWPTFVEMAQRRNVMTHNDGRVSQQYIQICDREKVCFDTRPTIGGELELTNEYLFKTILTVSKVGFMLAHTLWRKLLPDDIELANDAANEAIFNLLMAKRWRAAASFGEFTLTQPMLKGIKEVSKMVRVVNMAIAYKSKGEQEKASKVLDSIDWSACIRDFKLANALLRDDYTKASEIMVSIGKSGEMVNEFTYHHWPLFEEARGTVEFHQAYEKIYGHPFKEMVKKEARQQTFVVYDSVREKKRRKKQAKYHQKNQLARVGRIRRSLVGWARFLCPRGMMPLTAWAQKRAHPTLLAGEIPPKQPA